MAKNITKYSIFLASPGDLEEERKEIESVISELNLSYGRQHDIVLELVKWETHSAPGAAHTYTQDLITQDLGLDYDIFIGFLWQRFGTKTQVANSGTEEEFLNALKKFRSKDNIQIMFYFKESAPSKLDEVNIVELQKIRDFKKKLQFEEVLYMSFNNIDELMPLLRIHIPSRINQLKNANAIKTSSSNITSSEIISQPLEQASIQNELILEEDYGLLDYADSLESLLNEATMSLNKMTEGTLELGRELAVKAKEITDIADKPGVNQFYLVSLLKRSAKIMDNYTERLSIESPIFYDNFRESMDMSLKYLNVMSEFDSDSYLENMIYTHERCIQLNTAISNAKFGLESLYGSIKSLPRIKLEINMSKRKLVNSLQDLLDKFETAHKLSLELTSELHTRIGAIRFTNIL